MVKINGKETKTQGMSLLQYLVQEGYHTERLAVECNEEIVPRSRYAEKILQDGDVLEIVSFVGGG